MTSRAQQTGLLVVATVLAAVAFLQLACGLSW